jgi:nucleoside phosphorylase
MTDVSINLTRLCMEKRPEFLLFIGSAGSYGEKKIFEIIESRSACNIENSFLDGNSYTPIDNVVSAAEDVSRETRQADDNSLSSVVLKPERWSEATREGRGTRQADDNSFSQRVASTRSSVVLKPERWSEATREGGETLVNCSNYITSNSRYAKQYLEKNIHLENMEFYAVLKVAEKFGIPAGGVFVVTNYCDEHAHETFKKNHKEAMQRLAAYMNHNNKELRI